MLKVTALLPMKGESQRVVGKNLKNFAGQPLCTYILNSLQNSHTVEKIIVNTDSTEIAQVCSNFPKVYIHWRPEEIQGHHVSMNTILNWDLIHDPQQSEYYLQTHATNPLLTSKTINTAVETYFAYKQQYDSLFSATLFQSRLYDDTGKGINHDPALLLNTQDLPLLYEENSNIYVFSRTSFYHSDKKRIGKIPYIFLMDKTEALDIDTPDDFLIAEAAYKALRNK